MFIRCSEFLGEHERKFGNFRDAFKQFDKDGNGYIDKDELISLMESLGMGWLDCLSLCV